MSEPVSVPSRSRGLAFAAVLAGLALGGPAAADPKPGVDALLEEARLLRSQGRLEEAIRRIEEAHLLDPHPVLLNNIGKLYEELGDFVNAVRTYRRVVDDPATDSDLRQVDERRLEVLEPLLGRAWLRREGSLGGRSLLDGVPLDELPRTGPGGEIALSPGAHVFEWRSSGTELSVRWVEFTAGKTMQLRAELLAPQPTDVKLILPPELRGTLSVFGYELRSLRPEIERVSIARPGDALDVRLGDARVRIAVSPGQAVELAPALASVPGAPLPSTPERSIAPWIVLGVGAAVAVAGGGLLLHAELDRSRLRDELVGTGPITGLSHREAVEIQDRTNVEAPVGAALAGVGLAGVASGLLWWALAAP